MSTDNEDNNQSTEDSGTVSMDSMELSDETLEAVAGGVTVAQSLPNSLPISPEVSDPAIS